GRELVDVLSAGSGSANKGNIEIVFVDPKVAGNPQHGVTGEAIPRWNRVWFRRIAVLRANCSKDLIRLRRDRGCDRLGRRLQCPADDDGQKTLAPNPARN